MCIYTCIFHALLSLACLVLSFSVIVSLSVKDLHFIRDIV